MRFLLGMLLFIFLFFTTVCGRLLLIYIHDAPRNTRGRCQPTPTAFLI